MSRRTSSHFTLVGLFAAALAAIGCGTYLYLTAPAGKRAPTAIAPGIGDHQIGVAIAGSL